MSPRVKTCRRKVACPSTCVSHQSYRRFPTFARFSPSRGVFRFLGKSSPKLMKEFFLSLSHPVSTSTCMLSSRLDSCTRSALTIRHFSKRRQKKMTVGSINLSKVHRWLNYPQLARNLVYEVSSRKTFQEII